KKNSCSRYRDRVQCRRHRSGPDHRPARGCRPGDIRSHAANTRRSGGYGVGRWAARNHSGYPRGSAAARAARPGWKYTMKEQDEKSETFILFEVAGTSYALPSRNIKQLEMIETITPVP